MIESLTGRITQVAFKTAKAILWPSVHPYGRRFHRGGIHHNRAQLIDSNAMDAPEMASAHASFEATGAQRTPVHKGRIRCTKDANGPKGGDKTPGCKPFTPGARRAFHGACGACNRAPPGRRTAATNPEARH